LRRQRRTIRFVQVLLVLIAAGLLLTAGYSWGKSAGYEEGRRSAEIGASAPPSAIQIVVLITLGAGGLLGALLLQGGPETVRIPTPARLDELAGRAESSALERAAMSAGGPPSTEPDIR
jgi:TRAP-type C4-dicarboxylate transport system permease small subunit